MPKVSDVGTVELLTSYAPPTAEVGQGGALTSAEQDGQPASPDAQPASAYNAQQSPAQG